jgi:MarR family transcriptional regulator, lower aerobic nicotinate degradation pathway regulator
MVCVHTNRMAWLDGSLGFRVNRLAVVLRKELDARLAAHKLTAPQWAVLMRLRDLDARPQKEVGASLGMDKATVGGVIQRLERRALIRRQRNDDDVRAFKVSLTAAGRKLAETTAPYGEAVNKAALAGFSDEERSALLTMLQRAQRALRP